MAKPETANQRQQVQSQSTDILTRIWKGQIIPLQFFKKYWVGVIVVVCMLLMSIANKYECQSKISEIKDLEDKLCVARAQRMIASANYNTLIRETSMKNLLDTMHIDLMPPEQPPFNLSEYEAK